MYVLSAPATGCGPAGSLPTPDMPFIRDLILRVSAAEEDCDKPHPRWSEPVLLSDMLSAASGLGCMFGCSKQVHTRYCDCMPRQMYGKVWT